MSSLLTIDALAPATPVYVARLVTSRRKRGSTRRPALALRWWSVSGHRHLEADAPDDMEADSVIPARDENGQAVYLTLDPDLAHNSRQAIQFFRERLRAWRAEQAAAGRLVDPPKFAKVAGSLSTRDWA